MKLAPTDVRQLGTILGVWAHPDDESWSMAGLMMAAIANKQRVVCVTATKGEAGETADPIKWPKEHLAAIREKELAAAFAILKVKEHHWLGYADGKLPNVDSQEAVKQIADIMAQVQPDTIFTFGPDGLTGHEDHKTIYHWTKKAAKQSSSAAAIYMVTEAKEKYEAIDKECHALLNVYFNTDKPVQEPIAQMDLCFTLPYPLLERKLQALKAQPSQMNVMFTDPIGIEFIHRQAKTECFMKD